MRSYSEYISVSHWLGALALLSIALFVSGIDNASWIWFGLVQVAVGVMQLLTGIHFATSNKTYPGWFNQRLNIYWALTLGYFVILAGLWKSPGPGNYLLNAWLFVIPWFIAFYQFQAVSILKKHYLKQSATRLAAVEKKFDKNFQ